MAASPQYLPQYNAPKVSEYEKPAQILGWLVYLALGSVARLAILFLWIFMDLLGDAFDGWVLPVIGWVLVPWTTLMFSFMWLIGSDKVSGWEWIGVGIGLLIDFAFWAWTRSAFK